MPTLARTRAHSVPAVMFVVIGTMIGGSVLPACGLLMRDPDPGPSIDGPEAPSLLDRTEGWVIRARSSTVDILELPSFTRTTIELARDVYAVAGPDRHGRIAYVARRGDGHQLRLTDVRHTRDEALFERRGLPGWHGVIDGVCMSRDGRVALWSSPYDEDDPFFGQRHWALELIDLNSGENRVLLTEGSGGWVTWMADDEHLLIADRPRQDARRARGPGERDIVLLDVTGGGMGAPLGPGDFAFSEPSGSYVWIGYMFRPATWVRIDTATRSSEARRVPWIQPTFAISEGLVVAHAERTTGTEPIIYRSLFFAPAATHTLKVFDTATGEFATLFEGVTGYESISWGSR